MAKKYLNPKSIVVFIICLGLLFTFITLSVWSGHLFGTLSVDDNYYYNEGSYTKDNVTYNFTYWMGMVISSIDGFYVNTDIQLTISEAFINYYGEAVPQNENITVVLKFDPPTRYNGEFYRQTDHIQTEFDGNNRYTFSSYPLTVNYPVSESKHMRPVIFANGTIVAGSLDEFTFLDVQPAHMKTELNLAKVVVILTFWVVFFSIATVIFQSLNYVIKYDEKNKNNSKSKRKGKLVRGEKLILWNSFRNLAEGEIKVFAKWWKKYLYAGFLLIIVGVVCSVIFSDLSFGNILVPIGIGIFSIGLGFLSVTIANESDKKMEANANESFLKIWDDFGDKRILFLNQIRKGDLSLTEYMAWKCETYIDRAFDLMETSEIKIKNRKKMYNVYLNLLKQFPWQKKVIDDILIKDNVVTLTDVENLLNVYKKIRKNHLYDEKSNELIYLFDPFVKDIDPKITIDKQIDKFISKINETKRILEEIYGKQRRYLFMRLEQAKQLLEQKMKQKKGKNK